jgi:hypothetical protein
MNTKASMRGSPRKVPPYNKPPCDDSSSGTIASEDIAGYLKNGWCYVNLYEENNDVKVSTMSKCQSNKKVLRCGVSSSLKIAGNALYSTVYDEQS